MTSRSDSQRTAANTNETLLTPSNVNPNNFGKLFNYSLDYQGLAQPLYVPNVQIPGKGTHNVVYVATMADSVYAFDADNNQGPNAQPLWSVNFTDPANGITLASYATHTLPCTNANSGGPGFNQEGIVSTPVIDPVSGTLYVVAKTVENGTVRHRLHALDITNGQEKFGGPTAPITATSVSNKGHKTVFNSLHQKNRPGLLLLNGVVYLGFGSNFCNDSSSPWLLAYDATSLQQVGVFNASPDTGLASIWQSGQGLAADAAGNIYVATSEGNYDIPQGGQAYANSILQFSTNPNPLAFGGNYFSPWNVLYLDSHDLDLSSSGPLIVPDDQAGAHPHILVEAAKEGTIYVLDRDNLGGYNPNGDSQIVQELKFAVGPMFDSPTYWNGRLYFAGNGDYIKFFAVGNGQCGTGYLSCTPIVSTKQIYVGSHSPSISASGDTNAILWVLSGNRLYAFDALSLQPLYSTAAGILPLLAHFATQTIANGKVYIATRTTLEVYGLFPMLALASGGNQSGTVLTTLANPIQIQARDPYSGGIPNAIVTFSDGGKGGSFNPASAVTDNSGYVSTSYTLPKFSGNYTITASSPGLASTSFKETALPGAVVKLVSRSGSGQTAYVGTVLLSPLVAKAADKYGNGVPGISVTYSDQGSGGVFNPNPCVTDSNGYANVQYQLPTKPGTYTISASASNLKTVTFTVYAIGGPPAKITVTGGNNQTGAPGTKLPKALTALVNDQYGNPVLGQPVTFSDGGAGGSFSYTNPVNTDNSGTATQYYILPPSPGTFTVNATTSGAPTPAAFTETAQ